MTDPDAPSADRWDARYRGSDALFGTTPCTLLPEEAHRVPRGAEVLSLGEGDGRHALWLARERDVSITAMDISEVALARAARKAEAAGLRFEPVVADLTRQPLLGAAFDAVLWFFLHLPEPDAAALLGRARGALRPGGVLMGRAWHNHTPAGLTADDLRAALGPDGFARLSDDGVKQPPGTPSGASQRFTDFVWIKPKEHDPT